MKQLNVSIQYFATGSDVMPMQSIRYWLLCIQCRRGIVAVAARGCARFGST